MAVQQTIAQIIQDAQISEYLAVVDVQRGSMFPSPLNKTSPQVIYTEYKSVQWAYNQNPPLTAVNATSNITITSIGNVGDNIKVYVNDPIEGSLLLGSYAQTSGDTDTTILAASITTVLSSNSYGYTVTSLNNVITITARNGLGATINGNNLSVSATITPERKAESYLAPSPATTGTVFVTTVVDPNLGTITLSSYTQQAGDTTDAIFIANLIASIQTNTYGYTVIPYLDYGMYIVAPTGYGASINGNLATITYGFGSTYHDFVGGVNAVSEIPNTLNQFSGGVTQTYPSASLTATSNYLYWLCAAYNLQAINIRTQGGGGIIPPINPPQRPQPLYFTVDNTTPIPTGGNTATLTQFIGWNIVFSRGGITQTQVVDVNNQYFTWNPVTGILFIYGNATAGEPLTITPA